MSNFAFAERRSRPRYPGDGLWVSVRKKGRLAQIEGIAQDFNRHGLALLLDQPLPKDSTVYVSLHNGELKLDNVIGVVHNCISLRTGYRCGIQFRTCSNLQMDQAFTEQELVILETRFRSMNSA